MFYHSCLFIITLLTIKYLQYRAQRYWKNKYNNKPVTIKLSRVWLLLWRRKLSLEIYFPSLCFHTSTHLLHSPIHRHLPCGGSKPKGGSKFCFHLPETPRFCSNHLFTSIILRKSYINQSVRFSCIFELALLRNRWISSWAVGRIIPQGLWKVPVEWAIQADDF